MPTVAQLRAELAAVGEKTTGLKDVLAKRLADAKKRRPADNAQASLPTTATELSYTGPRIGDTVVVLSRDQVDCGRTGRLVKSDQYLDHLFKVEFGEGESFHFEKAEIRKAHAHASRLTVRLSQLPHAALVALIGRLAEEDESVRDKVDRAAAEHNPIPSWAVDNVLLSARLMTLILDSLPFRDCAAARVCTVWSQVWKIKSKRVLRPVDSGLIVSKQQAVMQGLSFDVEDLERRLQSFKPQWTRDDRSDDDDEEEEAEEAVDAEVVAVAFGKDGMYTIERCPGDEFRRPRFRRYSLSDLEVLAETKIYQDQGFSGDECTFGDEDLYGLAVPATGAVATMVRSMATYGNCSGWTEIRFSDALTLDEMKTVYYSERGPDEGCELYKGDGPRMLLPEVIRAADDMIYIYVEDLSGDGWWERSWMRKRPNFFRTHQSTNVSSKEDIDVEWTGHGGNLLHLKVIDFVVSSSRLYVLAKQNDYNRRAFARGRIGHDWRGCGRIMVANLQGTLLYTYDPNASPIPAMPKPRGRKPAKPRSSKKAGSDDEDDDQPAASSKRKYPASAALRSMLASSEFGDAGWGLYMDELCVHDGQLLVWGREREQVYHVGSERDFEGSTVYKREYKWGEEVADLFLRLEGL